MSIEGRPGPLPSGVYNGFSAPGRTLRGGAGAPAGKVLMAGVVAACVLGVGFGLFAKPAVTDEDGMQLDPDAVVQIEVGPGRAPVIPGAPANAAPMNTLPQGAGAPTVVVATAPAPSREVRSAPVQTEDSTLDGQRVEMTVASPGDCSQAPTPAARLACEGELPERGELELERTMEARRPPRAAEIAVAEPGDEADELIIPPADFADED
jgi:hypothetical protein